MNPMVGSTARDATPSGRPGNEPAPFITVPVEVGHVIVPLDGSPFAERALPVAAWVAAALGADVHLVEVVPRDEGEEGCEGAIRYLDSVSRHYRASGWDVVEDNDVGQALAETVAGSPGRVTCLATHGRDRSAAVLGSVAASLLERSDRPAVLVGPEGRAVTAADAPVVVAVDGTGRDEALVPVALGWAARLGRRLEIVTVAEPTPAAHREGTAPRRARGLAEPQRYVESLVSRARGAGVTVASRVVYDPVGVRDGLVPLLDRTAALVVLGSRRRGGVPRMVLGSHAGRVVHDAAVPAVAVPLPLGV
jgi:nucleotide-binding universal stress UspA family protein